MAAAGEELVTTGWVVCDDIQWVGDAGTELVGGDGVGWGAGEVEGEAVLGRSCWSLWYANRWINLSSNLLSSVSVKERQWLQP